MHLNKKHVDANCEPIKYLQETIPNLVSVIVPVYKVEQYLDECVESILKQSYKNIEVILVDDGSPDACPAICDSWAEKDKRVKVIHQDNKGLSVARNVGLSQSRGTYIVFVDSDDIVAYNLLELTVARLEEDHSDICIIKHCLFTDSVEHSWDYPEGPLFPTTSTCSPKEALEFLYTQRIHHYAQMRVVRRSLYESIGFCFPAGRFMEDMATTSSVLGAANLISIMDIPVYYYRQRRGSIVANQSHRMSISMFNALEDVAAYIKEFYPDLFVLFRNYQIKMLFYCWHQEYDGQAENKNDCGREETSTWIRVIISQVGWSNLTRLNQFKEIMRRLHLLDFVWKLHR